MNQQISEVHGHLAPQACKPFVFGRDYAMDDIDEVMKTLGVGVSPATVRKMMQSEMYADSAMDSIQGLNTTTASIAAPVQFLQNWLVGVIMQVTAARNLDNIIGISTIGSWEDAQVVQQVMELTGTPTVYGDLNNVPLTDWNINYVTRSVVRFELGMKVGPLEMARAARVRIDSAGQKRVSAAVQLEIQRNRLGFYGYNSGNNVTYGFLNDPNLPNYVSAVTGNWATATFLQIQTDILTALQGLRTQSQGVIDPGKTPITLAISTNKVDYLNKTSDFGISVTAWLKMSYPNVRVENAPELNGANGGADVFYCFADTVADGTSTDDMRTFIQVVPAKFQLLGVQQLTKGYEEDYVNASAGTMVKRPYAVKRITGI